MHFTTGDEGTVLRITASRVATVRAELAAKQGGRCAVCQGKLRPYAPFDPVLDHDHHTGAIRGVLHRGCNSLLGKVENNAPRYGVAELFSFCQGAAKYLQIHTANLTGLLHPTYKTADEKRLLRNTRARKKRAANKET